MKVLAAQSPCDHCTCECEAGWGGEHCDEVVCTPACLHGTCMPPGGPGLPHCICNPGWTGEACDQQEFCGGTAPSCSGSCPSGYGCTQVIIGQSGTPACGCAGGYPIATPDIEPCPPSITTAALGGCISIPVSP